MDLVSVLSSEFKLNKTHSENIISLIKDGNTIPFIARYRKEMTGAIDDQVLREFAQRMEYLENLDLRKNEVKNLIEELGQLTDEIVAALEKATTMSEVDDIYRPFRPKRKTRASVAKEKGLEPLAQMIFEQNTIKSPESMAEEFVNPELSVENTEQALQGASDIIAEWISDNAQIRKKLKALMITAAMVSTKAAKDEDSVYSMYYEYSEPVSKIAGHRILAIDRGEREEFLKVSLQLDEARALSLINAEVVTANNSCGQFVKAAAEDAYSRLIFPSVEREIRSYLTENADDSAIKVFAKNLRQLLLQPPIKAKVVMGLDPGFRTGCKVAVVNSEGKVLDTGVIYAVPPHSKVEEAKKILTTMIKKHSVELISIGNGTASRETEAFTAQLISELNMDLHYIIVNEAGASVYSASKLAATEFPDYDVSLRSAVSIARRLQDPLAELVKIDPKSIGVGQYQHDMPPKQLDTALGGVVEDCVNSVGADLNTASPSLLKYVAGINSTVASEIVKYRDENGAFKSRSELKKVPKLGPKAFLQCAGFLRIDGDEPLDNTAVHPESYKAAKGLLKLCGYSLNDLKKRNIHNVTEKINELGADKVAAQLEIGVQTLNDIAAELLKPGRDPRDELPKPILRTDVLEIEDLKPGMELMGTVRNVIDFGAFVDIGVHQDGLVHISQLCDRYIKHPLEAVSVGDVIKVYVLSVDVAKKRISLTCRNQK
ncbi:MAG: RNA-binding transcriptional accessory protein [Clostridia bacterium]|nr:RNA-binding transcriptional accessory protein [Clostridia bacterium]